MWMETVKYPLKKPMKSWGENLHLPQNSQYNLWRDMIKMEMDSCLMKNLLNSTLKLNQSMISIDIVMN